MTDRTEEVRQTVDPQTGDTEFILSGELDHYRVASLREQMDEVIARTHPKRVSMNLREVTFADSAGLGLILGRYNRIGTYGGTLELTEVPPELHKILRLSGADQFLRIRTGSGKTR